MVVKIGGIDNKLLIQYVEKIERLEEEKKAIAEDISDIYKELRSSGLDVGVVKKCIKQRKMDPVELEEEELLLHTYQRALGIIGATKEDLEEEVA